MSFRDFSKTHPETEKDTPNKPLDGKKDDTPKTVPDKSAAEKAPAPAPAKAANV